MGYATCVGGWEMCVAGDIYGSCVCVLWGCTDEFGVLNPFPSGSRNCWNVCTSTWLDIIWGCVEIKMLSEPKKKQDRMKPSSRHLLNTPTPLSNTEFSSGHGSVEDTEPCWQFTPPHHQDLAPASSRDVFRDVSGDVSRDVLGFNTFFPSSLCRPQPSMLPNSSGQRTCACISHEPCSALSATAT